MCISIGKTGLVCERKRGSDSEGRIVNYANRQDVVYMRDAINIVLSLSLARSRQYHPDQWGVCSAQSSIGIPSLFIIIFISALLCRHTTA